MKRLLLAALLALCCLPEDPPVLCEKHIEMPPPIPDGGPVRP